MECAAHLDVMKLDELLESDLYERGVDLLERIVAMLSKLIDPDRRTASFTFSRVARAAREVGFRWDVCLAFALAPQSGLPCREQARAPTDPDVPISGIRLLGVTDSLRGRSSGRLAAAAAGTPAATA
jgi:hypothetical protein